MSARSSPARLPVVVLISGGGSNLQALIDAIENHDLPIEIRAVVSNRPDAYGLIRAQRAGVATEIVDHKAYPGRAAFDRALQTHIDRYRPKLVVLAGFMRILTDAFVRHYEGRMLNIHPSLLPHFPGLDTHARALAAGTLEHGASVHFVTPELDGGPSIAQAVVPVLPGDTPETLAARVRTREHVLYPQVVRWFAEGRLALGNGSAQLDGQPLTLPVRLPYPDPSPL